MDKAILVIDMPDGCAKCPFVLHEDEGWLYCGIHNSDTAYAFQRADYCPLKPLPKKSLTGKSDYFQWGDWEDGWNACIDELVLDNI